jgi:putative tricarboxylic transport membrane protein
MSDRGVGLATLFFGAALLVLTLRLPEAMLGDPLGPRLWPAVLAGLFLVLGAALLASGRAPSAEGDSPLRRTPRERLRFWAVVALTILYPALLVPVGYLPATSAVMLATLGLYNPGRWMVNVTVAVGFSAVSYLLFHSLLGVYVPPGFLG